MARVTFTQNIQRHVACDEIHATGRTIREVLEFVFEQAPQIRSYIVDDQGQLRHHLAIFVDGAPIQDRDNLTDPVQPEAHVYVMQALSGGGS